MSTEKNEVSNEEMQVPVEEAKISDKQTDNPTEKKGLKPCAVCGKDIATNSKSCPSCGAKNKKPIFKKWWFWLIIVIIVIAIIPTGDDANTDDDLSKPSTTDKVEEVDSKEKDNDLEEPKKETPTPPTPKEFNPADYQTGITYDNLARNPDDYLVSKVAFNGKVIQIIEGDGETQARVAVDDDYDKIVFISYDSKILDSRVLEDDYITLYGYSTGLITYDSTMGGKISIPGILVEKIQY